MSKDSEPGTVPVVPAAPVAAEPAAAPAAAPAAPVVATTPPPSFKVEWDKRIGGFAAAVGKTQPDIEKGLESLVGSPSQVALDALASEQDAPFGDLRGALADTKLVPLALLRKHMHLLRGQAAQVGVAGAPEATPQAAHAAAAASAMSAMSFDVLPQAPSDSAWLEMLRAGGVLKVDQSTVISTIRAGLAHKVGLFDIPEKLTRMMERFADENEEQVTPEFFSLRRQLTRRSYAEIFEAIEGLDGNFVTEARKKQLLQRIDESLWPAITAFFYQLKSWQEAWLQGSANPALMMGAMMGMMSGGAGGIMPPGMMQPPDTGILRDHADAVADAVNKAFRGTGVQIAAAMAWDATKIREALTNTQLPAMIGAANREQMLRQLGVAVSATYPRMETNLTRFVLATLQVKDQPAGNEELRYFGSLFMLGSQIPWDQIGGSFKAETVATGPRDPFVEGRGGRGR